MEKTEVLTARISAATKAALEATAASERRTVSSLVSNLLDDWAAGVPIVSKPQPAKKESKR